MKDNRKRSLSTTILVSMTVLVAFTIAIVSIVIVVRMNKMQKELVDYNDILGENAGAISSRSMESAPART